MEPIQNKFSFMLTTPMAIVLAGIFIAGAIVIAQSGPTTREGNTAAVDQISDSIELTVRADDHILGDPEAPVIIVEFSDLECPFCKSFHETMKRVMEMYGEGRKVAWVYRHFPLEIHPKAPREAEATECAAELGGNLAFWEYTDQIFERTPSNNGLDLALLPVIARDIGLDKKTFEECLASGRHAERVTRDLTEAVNAGGRGTPFSIAIGADGAARPINGAVPFETIQSIIEELLGAPPA